MYNKNPRIEVLLTLLRRGSLTCAMIIILWLIAVFSPDHGTKSSVAPLCNFWVMLCIFLKFEFLKAFFLIFY